MNRLLAFLLCLLAAPAYAADIAYIKAPRTTGVAKTPSLSEQWGPFRYPPGARLVLVRDGVETVVDNRDCYDWRRSRDGKSLLVTLVDGFKINDPWKRPQGNADVYRYEIETGTMTNLTPNTPNSWEVQACEFNGGVAFLSDRDGWQNPHELYAAVTIYRMHDDGSEQQRIWHAGLGGVFGLSVGKNGRLYFASGENQGFRSGYGNAWSIWSVNPDGSDFQPEVTAAHYKRVHVFDFPSVTTDGKLLWTDYYDTRIYGTILTAPVWSPSFTEVSAKPTQFQSPLAQDNTGVNSLKWAWARRELDELTVQAHSEDRENFITRPDGTKDYVGMYSHATPTPGNGVYVTWTGNNGDNSTQGRHMDLGVYSIPNVGVKSETYEDLVKIKDTPEFHEYMGGRVCSDADVYGHELPLPVGEVEESLPEGSPYGVVGTSAVDINEWIEQRTQPVNNTTTRINPNPDDMEWVRILAFKATLNKAIPGVKQVINGTAKGDGAAKGYNGEGFVSEVNERIGWYEQLIPIKKWRTPNGGLHFGPNPPEGSRRIMRTDGLPDTSWQAQIPANQPWSLQLLDAEKRAIYGSTAQTWHQVVSRERRTNCQGCHAHWKPDPTPFNETFAAGPEYRPYINRLNKIVDVVYDRDIAPLNLGIPKRPWEGDNAIHSYESSITAWPQLAGQPPEVVELLAAWQATGFMAAGELLDGSTITPESGIGPYGPWPEIDNSDEIAELKQQLVDLEHERAILVAERQQLAGKLAGVDQGIAEIEAEMAEIEARLAELEQ